MNLNPSHNPMIYHHNSLYSLSKKRFWGAHSPFSDALEIKEQHYAAVETCKMQA
jgi:hypothetical protein